MPQVEESAFKLQNTTKKKKIKKNQTLLKLGADQFAYINSTAS